MIFLVENVCLNFFLFGEGEVLVLDWCYKAVGNGEQVFLKLLSVLCITKRYDKPKSDNCLCRKFWLGEQWSSDIAVSCNLAKHSNIWSENTRFETLWFSPLTRISINIAGSSLLHLLLLTSLNILSGLLTCGCHQDLKLLWIGPMAYNPHARFYYSKLLTYLSYDYGSLSNISGNDLGASGYRQVLNWRRC